MLLNYLMLAGGLLLLIKGADWLVRGAITIARSFQVSEFVIGLTVVSFGTSLPELIIAFIANSQGNSDLIIGNVIGSNIANIFLVLGVASVIYPLAATQNTVSREIPFTLLASLTLFALLNDQFLDGAPASMLTRIDGIVLMAFFCVFVYYAAQLIKSEKNTEWVGEQKQEGMSRAMFEIIVGIVGLSLGGRLAVSGAVEIAESWGMSETFVGLTVIAIGTSLPELATSAVAAYRRNADIAVGNVVGSNIFNIFVVLGLSSIVKPIAFNPINNVDVMVMIASTILLYGAMIIGRPTKTIQRGEGAFFVLAYITYTVFLINRG